MSSFELAAVAAELSRIIEKTRINKIYQLNPKTILLKIRSRGGGEFNLLIEAGKRIHLTFHEFEKPKKPPNFCMALRKYLENGVIEKITQCDFERIVELNVRSGGQSYRLIAELFERGNILLIGSDGKIMHALTYRRMRDRNILRGEEYRYPPQRGVNPKNISLEHLYKLRDFGQMEVVRGLARLLGIGGFYTEEILLRAGVDKGRQCSSLNDEEVEAIFKSLREILSNVESGNYKPHLVVDGGGNYVDAAPFPLKKYCDFSLLEVETFNKALDEYYSKAVQEQGVREIEEAAEREISKLERILKEQEKNLEELAEKARIYRQIGDVIYSHLQELNHLVNRVMEEKRRGKSWDEIVKALVEEKKRGVYPSIFFENLNPDTLTLRVSVDNQTFDLNIRETAQRNASEYYERSKKIEDKIEGLRKAIEETIAKIESIKSEAGREIQRREKQRKPYRKREWYEKFRWFYSSEGFLVIGGRDASTNEAIIRKYMEENDIVFHADIPGSPFVVIKTHGRQPGDETINEAAQFTASYSRAWREQIRSIDVYWVKPEQISKAPPSGEYLPRGSFMIYGDRNYVRNVPLEVAIGVVREGDEWRIIGGSAKAISKRTNLYVKIVPGKTPSGKLAKEIRSILADMAPPGGKEEILNIPLEEIQAFIPLGKGDIENFRTSDAR